MLQGVLQKTTLRQKESSTIRRAQPADLCNIPGSSVIIPHGVFSSCSECASDGLRTHLLRRQGTAKFPTCHCFHHNEER